MSRVVLPDPPIFAGDLKKYADQATAWMGRVKGIVFAGTAPQTAFSVTRTTPPALAVQASRQTSWGSGTYTTDGSGNIVVTHGLNAAPSVVLVQGTGNGLVAWGFNPNTLGTTTFTVQVVNFSAIAAVTGTSVKIMWFAQV